MRIDYESDCFPSGAPIANGEASLTTTWHELLWAAITVGRPNRQYVFQHGFSSGYEALFRLSLMRMALEQTSSLAWRLRRTAAAKTLDPTEKGAVNYFIGMAVCKLFAARLLNAPWMLHLDVFRPDLDVILTGRSRPDLIGRTVAGDWIAMESKGRISPPNPVAKDKAKDQATRVVSVNGHPPTLRLACITYFRSDVLQFFWRDPDFRSSPHGGEIAVDAPPAVWRSYYAPVLAIAEQQVQHADRQVYKLLQDSLAAADLSVSVHPALAQALSQDLWEKAPDICVSLQDDFAKEGFMPDGIAVKAGDSWLWPFRDSATGPENSR